MIEIELTGRPQYTHIPKPTSTARTHITITLAASSPRDFAASQLESDDTRYAVMNTGGDNRGSWLENNLIKEMILNNFLV